jgi:threonine synthase
MHAYADDLSEAELRALIRQAAASFATPVVTPLVDIGPCRVLELFHGPTLAFKDVALQFLGALFEFLLARSGGRLNIVGATSGDTGSAAISALRGRPRIGVTILHPEGRTSPLQRRQMTTVLDANIHNLSVQGSFDDCQSLVKSLMNDLEFKERHQLGAINSVNFARILAQIVYYFSAWSQAGGKALSFVVPTGNFGDIYAGYLAARMGLPVRKLVLASNANDILPRFFQTGDYRRGQVHHTASPSMDIQVASNFERYLWHLQGGEATRDLLEGFGRDGSLRIAQPDPAGLFAAVACDDEATLAAVKSAHALSGGYVLDPHTATAWHAAQKTGLLGPDCVLLATAHPAKFPETVRQALPGVHPRHEILDRLESLPERCSRLANDLSALKDCVSRNAV